VRYWTYNTIDAESFNLRVVILFESRKRWVYISCNTNKYKSGNSRSDANTKRLTFVPADRLTITLPITMKSRQALHRKKLCSVTFAPWFRDLLKCNKKRKRKTTLRWSYSCSVPSVLRDLSSDAIRRSLTWS
jgi:hypothetical protein